MSITQSVPRMIEQKKYVKLDKKYFFHLKWPKEKTIKNYKNKIIILVHCLVLNYSIY